MYFLAGRFAIDAPPPLIHPEYYYGFLGVAVAWQIAFLAIARDPVRLHPIMPAAVVEKWAFAASTFILFAAARAPAHVAVFAAIDLLLGALFLMADAACGRV
jgi:hypothetical protein